MTIQRAFLIAMFLLVGWSASVAARPMAGTFSSGTVPAGTTVTTTQTLPGGGSLTNNGAISTGASPGVTSTGPGPVTITNNGTITSNTTGIQTTGNSSSTLTNNGTISVGSSVTSKGGAAKATVGTGISQQAGH